MNQIVYAGKHLLTFSVVRHSHNYWELIYCTSGSGILVFDNISLPYREGDIAVIPPGLPHTNDSTDGFTNIHLNMLEPSFSFRQPVILQGDSNRLVLNAFAGAVYYFSVRRSLQLLSIYGHLVAFHIQELLDQMEVRQAADSTNLSVVYEIESTIVNNFPDYSFSLDAYLRDLPFNYDYARRLFKKETGLTPHRYLSDLRLNSAAQYLAGSGKNSPNISEVAHLCGFRDALYFSRMFKKKYGISPTLYAESPTQQLPAQQDADSIKTFLPDDV